MFLFRRSEMDFPGSMLWKFVLILFILMSIILIINNNDWILKVEDMSNCIGNYFLAQGLKKGDKVGVFMENCPEFLMIWFGLSKVNL